MAERKEITVRAQQREGRGKNDARRARREGFVPLTIYGGEGEAASALAPLKDLAAILRSEQGHNTIFTLDVEGVGQLIALATRLGRSTRPNLKVGICGEHGGDPDSIAFFAQAGLDYVSCSPYRVPIARLAAAHASDAGQQLDTSAE